MADTDLIARVYPVLYNMHGRGNLEINDKRYLMALPDSASPSNFRKPESTSQRGSRVPTRSPSPHACNTDDNMDCLELRFTKGPKTSHGFVFGRDERCDIIIPQDLTSISNYHFSITFENGFEDTDKYRLVLRDLNSRKGTSVTYDNKGEGFRRDLRWILSGHRNVCDKTIIVELPGMLLLRIVVFVPEISGHLLGRVEDFLRQRSPEALFVNLDLHEPPETETATSVHSSNSTPTLIEIAELGRGAFAMATHSWNISTGRVFARKTPLHPLTKNDRAVWRREAELLARLSHKHIIRIFELFEGPNNNLELHLEPVFGGTLRSKLPLRSYPQSLEVMRQCLSALSYLHGLSPPIVHRDIKPENILVIDTKGDIQVKLADFGFSREDRSLISLCGTPKYYPPELWDETDWRSQGGQQRSYSPAVDIWSFGVVASECLHDLPDRGCGLSWCQRIIKNIQANLGPPHHLSRFLLSGMVVMEPAARKSAEECYDHVVELLSMEDHGAGQSASGASCGESQGSKVPRPRYGGLRLPRPIPAAVEASEEVTVLPTIEDNGEGGDIDLNGVLPFSATNPPSSTRHSPGGPKTPAGSSRHSRRSAPYPSSRTRPSHSASASVTSSTATIIPRRVTRSMVPVVEEEGEEEQSIPEPHGAESGYFAANFLLDPLWVGSSVARMGREPPSSLGTSTATVVPQQDGVPQGRQMPEPLQRDAGSESEVALNDDWLRESREEDGVGGGQDQAAWTESERRLAETLLQEMRREG